MIASDWSNDQLGNLVNFKTGKLNSNAAVPNGRYPFFTCSQETFRTDTCAFDTECVLLAGNNANGVYPLKYFKGKFDAYQRTYVITPLDTSRLDIRFLYYAMRPMLEHLRSISTGAATKFVTLTILNGLVLQFPPLPTQRKIASILSAYDDLIENNNRRIAILEEMAQAIYREWFVNFRFPGHENVKLVQSTLGMIPERWKIGCLQDILTKRNDTTKPGEHLASRHYLPIECIPQKRLSLSESRPWQDAQSSLQLFERNDILFGAMRPYFHKVIPAPFSGITRSTCFVLRPKSNAAFSFSLLAIFQESTVAYANQHSKGSTIPYAAWDNSFDSMPLVIPPDEQVAAFDYIVRPMIEVLQSMYRRNHNLRTTRDLLLPKLISGQLDVEDIDIDLGMIPEEIGEPTAKPVDRKPSVRAAAEIDGASTASTTRTPEPIPIDDLDVDQVMAEFRQQARRLGTTTRAELLKAVSQELGYQRLGHNIEEVLKGHLRAAIRRKIIEADGELVCLHTPSMETYERDELIEAFHSVMRKNTSYVRKDVIRALANHLGFRRISDTVREPIKSAINGAIRRGLLGYQGELIWRED